MTTPNLEAEAWKASLEARIGALSDQVVRAMSANDRYILARFDALERRLNQEVPLDDDTDLARLAGEAASYLQLTHIDAALMRIDAYLDSKRVILQQLLTNQNTMMAQQARQYSLSVAILALLIVGVLLALMILGGEFAIISRTGSVLFGGP